MNQITQIIYDIRGCAFEIWREYRWGFSEAVYEAALELLLTDKGYDVKRQFFLQCYYKGRKINQTYRMDIVINDTVIVELKSVKDIVPEHRAQLINYCHLFQKPNCLLLNFGPKGIHSEWYYVNLNTREVMLK